MGKEPDFPSARLIPLHPQIALDSKPFGPQALGGDAAPGPGGLSNAGGTRRYGCRWTGVGPVGRPSGTLPFSRVVGTSPLRNEAAIGSICHPIEQ